MRSVHTVVGLLELGLRRKVRHGDGNGMEVWS